MVIPAPEIHEALHGSITGGKTNGNLIKSKVSCEFQSMYTYNANCRSSLTVILVDASSTKEKFHKTNLLKDPTGIVGLLSSCTTMSLAHQTKQKVFAEPSNKCQSHLDGRSNLEILARAVDALLFIV